MRRFMDKGWGRVVRTRTINPNHKLNPPAFNSGRCGFWVENYAGVGNGER